VRVATESKRDAEPSLVFINPTSASYDGLILCFCRPVPGPELASGPRNFEISITSHLEL